MNEIMVLHMMSSMMCCYFPYANMFPGQIFRPWGKMGYPNFSVRGTRNVPAYAFNYVQKPGICQKISRKLTSRKSVWCSAGDLIDFVVSVRLSDFSIEFYQNTEWHIIEVVEKHGCYALDGIIEHSRSNLKLLYNKRITSQLEVIRFTFAIAPYLVNCVTELWRYMNSFLNTEKR